MKWLLLLLLIFLPFLAEGQQNIYENWDSILKQNVSSGYKADIVYNSLDYDKLSKDESFSQLLNLLKEFDPEILADRNAELAFWINAYNIAAVNLVIENNTPASIKDIGNLFKNVWKHDAINIGGKNYTLNFIEHKILRSYNEPLIHFAIVCASLSCPDLLAEVYLPETVIAQMETNTRNFLKNTSKGIRADEVRKTVFISKIFRWFQKDFESGVEEFIGKYSDFDLNDYSVKYLDYNWRLNSP